MKTRFILLGMLFVLVIPSTHSQVYDYTAYPKYNGWNFHNFGTDSLPWDIFADSFIGIPSTQNCAVDPLDCALYALAEKICESGTCFGMSLMSLLMIQEEGHLGFCKPIWKYSGSSSGGGPTLKDLRRALVMMNCHQLGEETIKWFLQQLRGGKARDAKYAYNQVKHYLTVGDRAVLSMIPEPGKGHAVTPYRCEMKNQWRYIYIYDSNRNYPTDSTYYQQKQNVIEISPTGKWTFWHHSDSNNKKIYWSGNTYSGGIILVTPSSIAKPTSRNSLDAGPLASELNWAFVGDASISQISDNEGHQYFKTSTGVHNEWEDNEFDVNTGMDNIFRLPFVADPADEDKPLPEVYVILGKTPKNLNFEVMNEGKSYQFHVILNGELVTLESDGGTGGIDRLEFINAGTDDQELRLSSERRNSQFSLELYSRLPNQQVGRLYRVSDLNPDPRTRIHFLLSEDFDALHVRGEGTSIQYDLELVQMNEEKITRFEKRNLTAPLDVWQRMKPSDWSNLDRADLVEEKVQNKEQKR